MKKVIIIATVLMSGVGLLSSPVVMATSGGNPAAESALKGIESTGTKGNKQAKDIVKDVVGVMMFILGALSVIMIVWSGIQYTISAGDSGKVGKAKSTLIYSVVGLVVAIFAYAIVTFVIDRVK